MKGSQKSIFKSLNTGAKSIFIEIGISEKSGAEELRCKVAQCVAKHPGRKSILGMFIYSLSWEIVLLLYGGDNLLI